MMGVSLPGGPLAVVCLGAHPDDIEIGCGGTLLTLASSRRLTVDYLLMTGAEDDTKKPVPLPATSWREQTSPTICTIYQMDDFRGDGKRSNSGWRMSRGTVMQTLYLRLGSTTRIRTTVSLPKWSRLSGATR